MTSSEVGRRWATKRMLRPVSRWPQALGVLALSTCATVAGAQTATDRANARAAATAGADAFDDGDFGKAADLFTRAESLVHSPVHLWYVARSRRELGQLVQARESCLSVRREGLPSDASRGIVAAHEGCGELLAELEGRIPTLLIEVSGAVAGKPFKVLRNGEEVPAAMLGIPAPVDPGEHVVTLEGEGYTSSQTTVTLQEGGKESIHLTLVEVAEPVDPVVQEPKEEEPPPVAPEDSGGGLRPPPWSSYLAWGLGLGGIGVGVGFGLMAQSEADRADTLCGPGGRSACDPMISDEDLLAAQAANDAAGSNQIISIIGYSAGGAALATGFVIWLVHSGKAKETATLSEPRLRPVVGLGHLGLAGTF